MNAVHIRHSNRSKADIDLDFLTNETSSYRTHVTCPTLTTSKLKKEPPTN